MPKKTVVATKDQNDQKQGINAQKVKQVKASELKPKKKNIVKGKDKKAVAQVVIKEEKKQSKADESQ